MESLFKNETEKINSECDTGNTEYKWKLIGLDNDRFEKLVSQLKYRIIEGGGEAFYLIGIKDDGTFAPLDDDQYQESVDNLEKMAKRITCEKYEITKKKVDNGWIGEFLIREINTNNNYVDVKIAVAGSVDCGKSTLIGTITRGVLDNGRGINRMYVFNYKHEIDSGRTTSVGHQILGFDTKGNVINEKDKQKPMQWPEIVRESNKIISFYDMAGHEKYLRTTIEGLGTVHPDYCLIIVGANMGITQMTKEHMALCLSLKIPFAFVITKIDMAPKNILEETTTKVIQLIKHPGVRKIPYQIKTEDDVINAAKNITCENIVPMFFVSNVTGENLDKFKKWLHLIPVRSDYSKTINQPIEFIIDSNYLVNGVGVVVGGFLKAGKLNVGDKVLLGPNSLGEYQQTQIRSIHVKRVNVQTAYPGHYTCVAIKNVLRNSIKKGMILIDPKMEKLAVREFKAMIHIVSSHSTTIKPGYSPFLHIENIRQSVRIMEILEKVNDNNDSTENKMILRSGDKAIVILRFISKPEYLKPGMKIIFRENTVRAKGEVLGST